MLDKYIRLDEENNYVFLNSPCPLLYSNDRSEIYEDRPHACRKYHHTYRLQMLQIFGFTILDAAV
jgi:Fe-S-cluster containining protein